MDAAGALFGPIVAFVILINAPGAFDLIFVTSFCFAILGVTVLVLFVDPARRASAGTARDTVTTMRLRMGEVMGNAGFGYLVLAASVLSLATVSDAFVYLVLQQRLEIASGVFPLLYVATSLVYMAAAVPAGRLADRFGRRTVFLGGYLAIGLVYAILLTPATGFAGAVIAIAALGMYYAATDGVLMAMAGRILPKSSCATGMAVLTTSTSLARLLSSVLFGSLWTAASVGTAAGAFGIALVIAFVIAIVGLSKVKDHD
jgi:MFS family permease